MKAGEHTQSGGRVLIASTYSLTHTHSRQAGSHVQIPDHVANVTNNTLTHSLTHSPTHTNTHSHTRSLTHSLTYSPTHYILTTKNLVKPFLHDSLGLKIELIVIQLGGVSE